MDRALIVLLGAVVAAVGVIGVAAIWLTVTTDDGDPIVLEPGVTEGVSFPAIDHDPAGAAALVTAWQRWRTASFVSVGTWTRTIDARPDEPLTGDVYVAQAPPRRLVVRLGSVVERHGDEVSACSVSDQVVIAPPCVAGEGLAYDALVEYELGLVERYVTGPSRLYDVARSSVDCFRAELVVPASASPWGRWAEYCFDEQTGALRSARVRRRSATDVELVGSIRAEVRDDDFG